LVDDQTLEAIYEAVGCLELALPYADDLPAAISKLPRNLRITPDIALNFRAPKRNRGLRHALTSWATVPETPVNEDGNLQFLENKIRLPKH